MGTPFLGAEELILLGVTEVDPAAPLGAAQGRRAAAAAHRAGDDLTRGRRRRWPTSPHGSTTGRRARTREQMRARYPDIEGFVERDGGRVAYEVYGAGDPPIVFVPPWQIVHSRIWKAQIPDFARRHRVVAWDNRGNGRSDRPTDPIAHTTRARPPTSAR